MNKHQVDSPKDDGQEQNQENIQDFMYVTLSILICECGINCVCIVLYWKNIENNARWRESMLVSILNSIVMSLFE